MTLYDVIGQEYNNTRKPDRRIVNRLVELLDLPTGSLIADIGAGTGNYSNALADRGYRVIAIEPSLVMQHQAIPHPNVSWIQAVAEQISLPDNSVDAAIAIISLHHFRDRYKAIQEIDRIVGKGTLIIFTFKSDRIASFWLTDYFPYFLQEVKDVSIDPEAIHTQIETITSKKGEIFSFPLPKDLEDIFAAAGWAKPEIYLNSQIRKGISSFAKIPQQDLETGLIRLQQEIENGNWERKYGELKKLNEYDAGYQFLVFKN